MEFETLQVVLPSPHNSTAMIVVAEPPRLTVDELIKNYSLDILSLNNGDKTKTANDLGITIKTLYNWLHKWGVIERFRKHYQYK